MIVNETTFYKRPYDMKKKLETLANQRMQFNDETNPILLSKVTSQNMTHSNNQNVKYSVIIYTKIN